MQRLPPPPPSPSRLGGPLSLALPCPCSSFSLAIIFGVDFLASMMIRCSRANIDGQTRAAPSPHAKLVNVTF